MSVTKAATSYLHPDEAAAAYLAGTPMEYNTKRSRVENGGSGEGWADINTMYRSFWANFASGGYDFRLKPQHVYKYGDIVRVRSVSNLEERKNGAFPYTDSAFFAIVQEPYGREAEGDFRLVDGAGNSQITHVSDFEFVASTK